jgi:hypothetical protein
MKFSYARGSGALALCSAKLCGAVSPGRRASDNIGTGRPHATSSATPRARPRLHRPHGGNGASPAFRFQPVGDMMRHLRGWSPAHEAAMSGGAHQNSAISSGRRPQAENRRRRHPREEPGRDRPRGSVSRPTIWKQSAARDVRQDHSHRGQRRAGENRPDVRPNARGHRGGAERAGSPSGQGRRAGSLRATHGRGPAR